jgi:hypothetical protein
MEDLETLPAPELEEELDLEPVRSFMEDYIGQIIVNITGHKDLTEIGDKTRATIVMGVDLEGEEIKFRLTKLNGQRGGSLIISPTKHGMFTEKLSEEELDLNSMYRISFYGGYSLEYLDSKGMGIVTHQE